MSAGAEPYRRPGLAGVPTADGLLQWGESVEGDVYRQGRGRRTVRVVVNGKAYFLKFHSGVGWLEILKNWLVGKRPVLGAENEYRACRLLEDCGLNAPRVAAFAAGSGNPAARRSLVLCDELTGFTSLEDVVDGWDESPPDPVACRRLAMGVAGFVRQLHEAGVVHRDLYLCHLLLRTDAWAAGEVELGVLDLHRARVVSPVPDYWRRRDLAALLFSALDAPVHRNAWLRFVRVYSGRPLREAFAGDGAFWRSVYRRALRLYGKGLRKGLVKGRFQPSRSQAR
ncbi:MAG: lipopolysaccharide core heptose(I) kinase RfaP [Gammaproteobacteria bacterium]|nr:lipopolysaccharide core heptose(I) kinase RfaP [Gammaproteobacteria bacterium]MDE0365069.1 lipopolysaccharide core heptose(I) kinase RfaP [Gammaproteobacteria bacterium]